MTQRIPARLTDNGLSRRSRMLRDIAESQGWRLFKGGGGNGEPWGIRCISRPSIVLRGANLDEIAQHICDIHLPPYSELRIHPEDTSGHNVAPRV